MFISPHPQIYCNTGCGSAVAWCMISMTKVAIATNCCSSYLFSGNSLGTVCRIFTIYGVFETALLSDRDRCKIMRSYHHQGTKGTLSVPTPNAGCPGGHTTAVIH